MSGDLGRLLMIAGVVMVAIGALFSFGARIPWLGRLPGDIVVERENVRFYFPIVTSIIISIILTVIAALFRR
jgi:hypothetical protein